MSSTIGFIGVGNMGWPMAARLVGAGYQVSISDADPARCHSFTNEVGGKAAASAAAAAGAEFVITMLPASTVVEAALRSPEGILAGLQPGTIVLEMSSGDPVKTQGLAADIESKGATIIDAPVSGGVSRARNGELAIMVGGPDDAIGRAMPLLNEMGTSIMRTGPLGSGHAMKALNNLVSAGGFLIGVEAMLIGQRFGLDPEVIVDVLNASTGVNNSTQKKFKQYILSRSFDAGFGLDLMVKDISIAAGLAGVTGTNTPFSDLCHQLWAQSAESLGPGRDHTEMARYSEQLGGAELWAASRRAKST